MDGALRKKYAARYPLHVPVWENDLQALEAAVSNAGEQVRKRISSKTPLCMQEVLSGQSFSGATHMCDPHVRFRRN